MDSLLQRFQGIAFVHNSCCHFSYYAIMSLRSLMIWLNECRRGCAEKGSRICSFIQMKCLNLSHHFGRGQRKSLFSWRSGVKQKMSFKHYCRYVVCFDVFDSGIHEVGRLLPLLICCGVCYCGSAHFDSLCECCSSTGRPVWKSSETRLQW